MTHFRKKKGQKILTLEKYNFLNLWVLQKYFSGSGIGCLYLAFFSPERWWNGQETVRKHEKKGNGTGTKELLYKIPHFCPLKKLKYNKSSLYLLSVNLNISFFNYTVLKYHFTWINITKLYACIIYGTLTHIYGHF